MPFNINICDMKFEQYIKESKDKDKLFNAIKAIHKNCQPYLLQWLYAFKGSLLKPLYRGSNNKGDIFTSKTRQGDRKPLNTPPEIQKGIDDYFEKKYGHRYRSSSYFTTGLGSEARDYGKVYMIFPVGRFNYIYNPNVIDLYLYTNIIEKGDTTKWESILSGYKTDNQGNLFYAINSGVEIMIKSKGYLGISDSMYGDIVLTYFIEYGNKKPTPEDFHKVWFKLRGNR